jgi:tripartite-type tricarboxylate transporter receptor subunit TctC
MKTRRTVLKRFVGGAAAAVAVPSLWAQIDNKSAITLLVNAGSTVEFTARLVAEQLRAVLGNPVVVLLKEGVGGRIAVAEVMRSAPDGRTLLLSTSSPFAIYPNIYKKLNYDPSTDFSFIGSVAWFDVGLATSLKSGLVDMKQTLAWAKANGADALYAAAPGNGSAPHFVGIATSLAAGVPMTQVAYKSAGPAIIDLIAGRVPLLATGTGSLVEMHRAGKIRIVAVSGAQRSLLVPEVPTLTESGVNVTFQISAGLYGPAKMPQAMIDCVYAAMLPMMSNTEVRNKLIAQGMRPTPLPGPQLASWLAQERKRVEGLARAVGYEKEEA